MNENKSLKKYILQIISLSGIISCSLGICLNSQGVFLNPVAKDLNVMVGTYSMQNTISYIITSFSAVYYARNIHRINNRRLLLFGALLTSLSFILVGFSSNMFIIYLLGIMRGIGSGVFAVAMVTIGINNWFKEKRGLITSIVFSTSGAIGIVLPPFFTSIMELSSWRFAYVVMGLIAFLLIVPALFSDFTFHPSDQQAFGKTTNIVETKADNKSNENNIFIMLIGISIIYNMVLGFAQLFPGYASSIGFNVIIGSLMLSMAMFGNVISKLLSGIMSDRWGSINVTILMISINLLSLIAIILIRETWALEIAAFGYGVMYSVITVCLALVSKTFYSDTEYHRNYPIITLAGGVANCVSTSILGYIYDFSSSYYFIFLVLIVLHIMGFFIMMYISRKSIKLL